MIQQLLWISPEGRIVRVSNHQSFADSVTGTHPSHYDHNLSTQLMFDKGWIRGIHEEGSLYLNNSFDRDMAGLDDLPPEQRQAIYDYAESYHVSILNGQRRNIGIDESMFENKDAQQISPELKQKLASLYLYFSRRLGIREIPTKVTLTKDKKNAENPFGLTGYYDHLKKTIKIYVTERHDTDILRSFAHEVIHHWQNERGTLHPREETNMNMPIKHDTHPHYAQDDPWLRKREMEAYLFGNILFRDWQDENRMGPPKVQPFLPQPYD